MRPTRVARELVIQAPVHRVFAAITDYERYVEVFPEVRAARILRRRGPDVEVQYEAGRLHPVRYTFLHHEECPGLMSWSLVAGDMMRDNHGSWRFEPEGGGRTRIDYHVEVTPRLPLPAALVRGVAIQLVSRMLETFRRHVESPAAGTTLTRT